MSDRSSEAVRAWYSKPEHFVCTDVDSKIFDWSLLRHLGYDLIFNEKVVVDLGPSGLDAVMFAQRTKLWIAVDFVEPLLQQRVSWRFPGGEKVKSIVADFRALDEISNASIDTVLDYSSTDHIEEGRERARAEIFRILKPQRYYVLTYPNACFYPGHVRETRGDFGYEVHYTPEEIVAEVVEAGFTIVYHNIRDSRSGLIACKPEPTEGARS